MLKFGLHKAQNILKRSPVGDFNIPTWHIGNSDESFAGSSQGLLFHVPSTIGKVLVFIALTPPNRVKKLFNGEVCKKVSIFSRAVHYSYVI